MISWFFLTKFTNNHRFIISILILNFAINVIGKMHELTEEANEENCLSSVIGTWYMKDWQQARDYQNLLIKTRKGQKIWLDPKLGNLNQSFFGFKEASAAGSLVNYRILIRSNNHPV